MIDDDEYDQYEQFLNNADKAFEAIKTSSDKDRFIEKYGEERYESRSQRYLRRPPYQLVIEDE